MKELIRGAYDLHVHPGPDVQTRKITDLEQARRIVENGMGGFAIKCHYLCTAQRAEIVNTIYPDCYAIGTLTLNHSMGGLNPVAVEIAARAGAKIIWLPSVDSKHERDYLFGKNSQNVILPYWAKILKDLDDAGIGCPPITLTDDDGRLKDEVRDILSIARQYDICVATSHISQYETFAVAKASHEMGYQKLLISHVLYPSTRFTLEERKELMRLGALLEYSYSTFTTKKTTYEQTLKGILESGPDNCIISSDLGMPNGEIPDVGLQNLCNMLYRDGITPEQIHKMNRDNPAYLIGK